MGDGWKVGDGWKLGDGCELGAGSKLGDGCKLGAYCTLGEDAVWLGGTVKHWLTLSNVDGSGRQIKAVRHTDGEVKIEGGCFIGSLDEFVAKAQNEGKSKYVAIISAVASAIPV